MVKSKLEGSLRMIILQSFSEISMKSCCHSLYKKKKQLNKFNTFLLPSFHSSVPFAPVSLPSPLLFNLPVEEKVHESASMKYQLYKVLKNNLIQNPGLEFEFALK